MGQTYFGCDSKLGQFAWSQMRCHPTFPWNYVYMYIFINIITYIYIYTYIHRWLCVYIYIYIHDYIYIIIRCEYIYIYTYTYIYIFGWLRCKLQLVRPDLEHSPSGLVVYHWSPTSCPASSVFEDVSISRELLCMRQNSHFRYMKNPPFFIIWWVRVYTAAPAASSKDVDSGGCLSPHLGNTGEQRRGRPVKWP